MPRSMSAVFRLGNENTCRIIGVMYFLKREERSKKVVEQKEGDPADRPQPGKVAGTPGHQPKPKSIDELRGLLQERIGRGGRSCVDAETEQAQIA